MDHKFVEKSILESDEEVTEFCEELEKRLRNNLKHKGAIEVTLKVKLRCKDEVQQRLLPPSSISEEATEELPASPRVVEQTHRPMTRYTGAYRRHYATEAARDSEENTQQLGKPPSQSIGGSQFTPRRTKNILVEHYPFIPPNRMPLQQKQPCAPISETMPPLASVPKNLDTKTVQKEELLTKNSKLNLSTSQAFSWRYTTPPSERTVQHWEQFKAEPCLSPLPGVTPPVKSGPNDIDEEALSLHYLKRISAAVARAARGPPPPYPHNKLKTASQDREPLQQRPIPNVTPPSVSSREEPEQPQAAAKEAAKPLKAEGRPPTQNERSLERL